MQSEKIEVIMENGQSLEVVVLSKRATAIEVVLGEGVHSVKCEMRPTKNELAYVGSAMGREIIYEKSVDEVQKEIDRLNPALRKSRPSRT